MIASLSSTSSPSSIGQWIERALEILDGAFGASTFLESMRDAGRGFPGETALRALVALWMVACVLAFVVRAVRVLLPDVGLPLRWSSIIGLGTWLATAGFHFLQSLGAFHLLAAALACTALAMLAGCAFPGRAPLVWALRREMRGAKAAFALFRGGRFRLATAIFAGFFLLLAVRSVLIPPLGWDYLTYHGARAVLWIQSGQFTFPVGPGPFDIKYRHFWGGGEVLTAWAVLPFRSDLLANLATVVQWIGVGLATWALARGLGLHEPFASTAAAVVMFVPTMQLEVNSGYAEVAMNAALLQGIALALHCLRKPNGPAVVVSAMSLGVAAGVKLLGAPPGVIFFAVLAGGYLLARGTSLLRGLAWIAAGIACAALPVIPWIARAWSETGYPLSPMPVTLFGTTLGISGPALSWYQERPSLEPYTWASEKRALLEVFSPLGSVDESLGCLALIPILALPLGLFALGRRRPWTALLAAAGIAVPIWIHFSSAMTVPRLVWPTSVSRYLITSIALIVPVSLAWCRARGALSQAYRRLLLIYPLFYGVFHLRLGWGGWEHREMAFAVIALVLLGACLAWIRRRNRLAGLVASLGAVVLSCSLLQWRRDATRPIAFAESFALHPSPRYWARAVGFVDERGGRHEIAVTGGPRQDSDGWFYYGFLGSRFQNEAHFVPPTVDGGIAHFGPRGDLAQRADVQSWIARLETAGITEVITFAPRSIEQDWMDRDPKRFQRLAGDVRWGLYRFVK